MKKRQFSFSNLMQSKITWAVIAELLILLVCFIIRPDFFSIKYQPATGMLYGSLIDIVNRSAEITIIAMGMTLVLALGGTDLSVGSLVALSGALALKFLRWDVLIYNTPGDYTVKPFILVILVPLAVCTLMGLFNGFMISRIGMQPIIATLILMVCGRGIAQIVTNGKQFTTLYSPFRVIGQGSLFFLPMPIIITIVVVAAVSLFVRKTAFGTMVESVGINPSASRLSGINSKRIIMIVFALTAFLSAIAGLITASRVMSNDSNNCRYRWYEHERRQVQPCRYRCRLNYYPYDSNICLLFRYRLRSDNGIQGFDHYRDYCSSVRACTAEDVKSRKEKSDGRCAACLNGFLNSVRAC